MNWQMKAAAAVVVLTMAGVAAAADFQLPLTVQEPAGAVWQSAPVSGGIPLPDGQFAKGQAFALFDGDKEVPLQTLPLVVDTQGKLRWILLDFQTDLAAKQNKSFTLKAVAPKASPATPLKVTDAADAVKIDTGKAVITISRTRPFGLFDNVTCNGKAAIVGGQASYTDAWENKQYVADKPTSVVVEYAGPLRTTVAIKGKFVGDDKSKLGYVARVTAWAGRSDVHVKYSLTNSNPDHYCFRLIKDSTVELKLPATASGVTAGGVAATELGSRGSLTAGLRPGFAGAVKAISGDDEKWVSKGGKGEVIGGWIAAKADGANVYVADLYFVEDPARSLSVDKDRLRLVGVGERFDGAKDAKGNPQGQPHPEKGRWILDCSHLSSQYVIDFGGPADPMAASSAAKAMPHVIATPDWYFDKTESLAVGKFGTQADELACYATWKWTYDPKRVPTGPGLRMARYIKDLDNHFESEQDTLDGMAVMYLRTGHRAFLDQGQVWANYHMDTNVWRTDGWQWKDGGVWWMKGNAGPIGNRPTRVADPVTGVRNYVRGFKVQKETEGYGRWLVDSKRCYCHNWGEGLADWFCLTGDRDALEAMVDNVEQDYDTQTRAFAKTPGKPAAFSRDFTRSCFVANAARLVLPEDPFVVKASDGLAAVYFGRPAREPRGLVNDAGPYNFAWAKGDLGQIEGFFKKRVGERGLAEMKKLGVTMDPANGQLTDPKTGAKWFPINEPHTWMYPPLSRAMETYYRITGNEDALDWLIAYGQAASYVLYQPLHGNLAYGAFMTDFPLKGINNDLHTWTAAADAKDAEGIPINGYLACFHPDVAARAYELAGDTGCKQRALDFWNYGSHRGYYGKQFRGLGTVAQFVNVYGQHDESVCFTGKTFYIWAHQRADEKAPAAIGDLAATVSGDKAKVAFTAPADQGGRVVRYQVKCSDKPMVSYQDFLKAWSANTDAQVTNWWMAANLAGEPAPKAAGAKEGFEVTGVPAGAKYFAICTFDDSNNRSEVSNNAQVK